MKNKLLLLLFISFSLSLDYSDYGPEIFYFSGDATTQSLGGIATINSMSLVNSYSLNNSHIKGRTLLSYAKLYGDIIDYFQCSYIVSDYNKSKIGISLLGKSIDKISNTQEAWEDIGGDISQDDIDYTKITNYMDKQISFIIFYSYNARFATTTLKIKPVYNSLLMRKAYGVSIDLGFSRQYGNKLQHGFIINDALSFYKWVDTHAYSIYPQIKNSFNYRFNKLSLYSEVSISTNKTSNNKCIYRLGYEYLINNTLSIRSGYSNIKSFSVGIGIIYNNIEYSYSLNPNLNDIILGHDHQFSILLDLKNNKNG